MNPDKILAVVGFSRSGTSLTMRLLHAAGVPVVADNHLSFECAEADIANPPSWRTEGWWRGCQGKAVKLLEPQRLGLPAGLDFDFVWCQRSAREQAKSQLKLLRAWVAPIPFGPDEVQRMMEGCIRDTATVQGLLQRGFPRARFCLLHFERTLTHPRETAQLLCRFIGAEPGEERLAAMTRQVLPRGTGCYPGMFEEFLNPHPV